MVSGLHYHTQLETMADHLQRDISVDGKFFGLACITTDLVNEACRRHDAGPLAAVALGRALTANALLAALLKDEQRVMLRFEGNGPLKKIITEGFASGTVRGFVAAPHADLPIKNGYIDVAGGLGNAGLLTVTKDIGAAQNYEGTVQLYTSEIGEDVAYYLTESEQTPSAIGVSVRVHPTGLIESSGGFLLQSLPPADESLIDGLEANIQQIGSISDFFSEGNGPDELLHKLFGTIPHRTLLQQSLKYQCSCSHSSMQNALLTLEKKDLQTLKEERPEGVEVRCEFCGNTYLFDQEMLEKLSVSHK